MLKPPPYMSSFWEGDSVQQGGGAMEARTWYYHHRNPHDTVKLVASGGSSTREGEGEGAGGGAPGVQEGMGATNTPDADPLRRNSVVFMLHNHGVSEEVARHLVRQGCLCIKYVAFWAREDEWHAELPGDIHPDQVLAEVAALRRAQLHARSCVNTQQGKWRIPSGGSP